MMPFSKKIYKLSSITVVYWFLLLYIIAALSWWYIALEKQNKAMTDYKIQELVKDDPQFENRLNTLTNNILLAAQIDSGNLSIEKEEINLSVLADGCVQDFKQRFVNRIIESSIEPDLYVIGDTLLMQIAVNNLLENALKYSPEDSTVNIDLTDEGDRINLEISDEGSGIDDAEKKQVFNKFYRVGNENTRKTKGTGLGLYITKKIIEDHGAEINITDNTPRGTIFGVNFYK
ncbi:MAG: hypothetical protein HYX40_06725 [Sphingobacteriales bacterium]|nr:hypothetical protein [Sphingobacteriales bacterium]